MGRYIYSAMAGLLLTLTASHAAAVDGELRLIGLGLHQETGRNIYLGGIHIDNMATRPDDYVSADAPRVMEYRVVARRTSVRSLLGNIMLQSELSTGTAPDDATLELAAGIMSTVKGSLYAGDALEIRLTAGGDTVAALNGFELAQVPGREVADYLLQGWTGEKGPSTAFRDSILAVEVEPALLSAYYGNETTPERLELVASWFQVEEAPVAEQAVAVVEEPVVEEPVAEEPVTEEPVAEEPALQFAAVQSLEAAPAPVGAAVPTIAFTSAAEVAPAVPATPAVAEAVELATKAAVETPPAEPEVAEPVAEIPEQPIQVALATPAPVVEIAEVDPVAALGAVEYSQRLGDFNTRVIKQVYANIRYPRSAVRRNIQGTLELDLTLGPGGELVAVAVATSSGYNSLDAAAVKAAEKAFDDNPLADIDPVAVAEYGAEDDQLVVPVPVSFRLME